MSFEIGDIIEVDFGKEYIVINYCVIDKNEYYLVMDKENLKNTIILQKNENSDEIIIVKKKEEIRMILEKMVSK